MHAFLQALFVFLTNKQAIDHHFYIVIFIAVHLHALHYLAEFTINANMEETLLADALKEFLVMPLSVAHKRRQEVNFALCVFVKDESENALLGVLHHALTRQVRIGFSRTSIEQTEKVVNLSNRADGRTGILVRSLLLDANHRT